MFENKQALLDNSNAASLTRHGSEALAQHIAKTEQQQNSLSKQESNYRGDEVSYDVFDYSSDEEEDIEDVANFIQRQVILTYTCRLLLAPILFHLKSQAATISINLI